MASEKKWITDQDRCDRIDELRAEMDLLGAGFPPPPPPEPGKNDGK